MLTSLRLQIRAKFLTICLSLSLVPLIVVGLIVYQRGEEVLQRGLGSNFHRLAHETMARVDQRLYEAYHDTKALAGLELMQEVLTGDVDGKISAFLLGLRKDYGHFAGIDVLNRKGEVVASSRPEAIGGAPENNDLFRRAIGGTGSVGDMELDPASSAWVVTFAMPIEAAFAQKTVVGVLIGRWRSEELIELTQGRGRISDGPSRGYLVVLRRDGLIISAPEAKRAELFRTNLLQAGVESARLASRREEGYAVEPDGDRKRSLIGYSYSKGFKDFPGLGWYALVIQDAETTFAPIGQLKILILAIGVVATLGVTTIAFVLARRMTDPIVEIANVARRVAQGDLSGRINHVSGDEVGALSEVVNQMIDDLGRQRAQLVDKAYVESIIGNMTDTLIVVDPQGVIRTVNPAALTLLGYRENELIGQSIDKIFPPDEQLVGGPAWQELRNKGAVDELDRSYVTKDGRRVSVSISGSLLRDRDGVGEGVVCIGRDVTARKQIEEESKRARDAALEAARVKSDFLANMSHEIRTPMNGVIGMTGLLLDTELTHEQREYAEAVRTSGEVLLTLINDILDFSKIEAGRLDLEVLDFDLRAIVEEVVELLAVGGQAKGLEVASLIHASVPTVLRGDPGRLRQILTNLLGNAIKFTEKGEVVVRVDRVEETIDTVLIRVEVADTGVGLSPDGRARLFRSFSQADTSTTRKYGGTGLGLAISKRLVELFGGGIGVESELGKGSTFWFTALLAKGVEGPRREPRSDLRGLRVLIVDDNATNRQILQGQLLTWGMEGESVADGNAALERLRIAAESGVPYDLAILDMHMPGMDGLELARGIKAEPAIAPVRLVMLTSVGLRGQAEAAQQVGVAGYLTKPVRQSRLFECLATVMGAPPQPAAVTEPTLAPLVTRHSLDEAKARARRRVLIAEDNVVNQRLAVRMLEKAGYRTDVVANGREAVETLGRNMYDVVLMDCQMPEMDGFEAARAIRSAEADGGRRVPIIAVTASAMEGDREKCLAAGMDGYLAKPIKPEELETAIQQVLHGGSEPSAVPAEPPLDLSATLRAVEGDKALLTELATLFLNDCPQRLDELRQAVASDDAARTERAAHGLKGAVANFGAEAAYALAAELEAMGRRGDLAGARSVLPRLDQEVGRLIARLVAAGWEDRA